MKNIYATCDKIRNYILAFVCLIWTSGNSSAQTFHAMIFSDPTESAQRGPDRKKELENMTAFCTQMAGVLNMRPDIKSHGGSEFKSTQFLSDLQKMEVNDDDIVLFYYNGHGGNWGTGDWPHMCWRDANYWTETAFADLQKYCDNAKLILCFASCCNSYVNSRGYTYGISAPDNINLTRAKQLFTGFSGKKRILSSSSKKGKYSYGQLNMGSTWGISFREAMCEILSDNGSIAPTWENVMQATKEKAYHLTRNVDPGSSDPASGPQEAQWIIKNKEAQAQQTPSTGSTRKPPIQTTPATPPSQTVPAEPSAIIHNTTYQANVSHEGTSALAVNVDFTVSNLPVEGARIVAFLNCPEGVGVEDLNGDYCTTDGKVSVGVDFTCNKQSARLKGDLYLPLSELHIAKPNEQHYIVVAIFDRATNKDIGIGDYIPVDI